MEIIVFASPQGIGQGIIRIFYGEWEIASFKAPVFYWNAGCTWANSENHCRKISQFIILTVDKIETLTTELSSRSSSNYGWNVSWRRWIWRRSRDKQIYIFLLINNKNRSLRIRDESSAPDLCSSQIVISFWWIATSCRTYFWCRRYRALVQWCQS